jgi:PAS domain S-box-containing protein
MFSSPIVNDQNQGALNFALLASHPLPTWIIDAEQLRVRFANTAAATLFEYTTEEFECLNINELIAEKSRHRFPHFTRNAVPRFNLSCLLKKKSGEEVAVELHAFTFTLQQKLYYRFECLLPHQEGTERISTFTSLEVERERHDELLYQATILEHVSDIIVTTDLAFRVKIWNKTAERYYEISAEEARGRPIGELVNFTFYDTSKESSKSVLETSGFWQGEVSTTTKGGNVYYFLHSVKDIYDNAGEKIGYLAIGRDITDKKRTEQKLRKSEQFYRTLIADSLDGMILLDEDGFISFSSPSVKNVLGYEVDEVLGRNGFDFVHPDDIRWAFDSFQKELIENPEVKFIVVRLLKKDGQWLWCTVRGHNLLKNRNIGKIAIYFHDDTLRRQATEALKESEKRFRKLIKDLYAGILLQDAEGRILMTNDAAYKMFGVPESELLGRQIWQIFAHIIKEDGSAFLTEERPSYKAITSKKAVKDVVMGVWHVQRNEYVWLLLCADPIFDDDGKLMHIVCSFMDITERKKLEQELISKQIGHQRQLTQATMDGQENERREIGKELHDNIGQQLTTVKLFLDLASGTADAETREMLSMAVKGVSDIINEVRAMSRSLIPSTLKDLGLVESVNELVDSIARTNVLQVDFNPIEFEDSYLPENQQLTLFRIIQEQFNNIVKHAGARNVFIKLETDAIKKLVLVEIRDDGKGFDTKKVKKGLGFINIRNRVELFNGKMDISSQPGKGCHLRLSMPFTGGVF